MSHILFNRFDRSVKVAGRAYWEATILTRELMFTMLGLNDEHDTKWHALLSKHVVQNIAKSKTRPFYVLIDTPYGGIPLGALAVKNALCGGSIFKFRIDKQYYPVADVQLNTALRLGNDVIKFLARLHGQCEGHAFVERGNAEWLASIIMQGIALHILDEADGWLEAVCLLESAPGAVVMSHSGGDGFPSEALCTNQGVWPIPSGRGKRKIQPVRFSELPRDVQWSLGLAAIRTIPALELRPDNWNSFFFGRDTDAMKICAELHKLLPKEPEDTL